MGTSSIDTGIKYTYRLSAQYLSDVNKAQREVYKFMSTPAELYDFVSIFTLN
jgi:hypothetical protein